ncbi:hypothetical protein Q5752_004508 [Cryptotrichosporon argae]
MPAFHDQSDRNAPYLAFPQPRVLALQRSNTEPYASAPSSSSASARQPIGLGITAPSPLPLAPPASRTHAAYPYVHGASASVDTGAHAHAHAHARGYAHVGALEAGPSKRAAPPAPVHANSDSDPMPSSPSSAGERRCYCGAVIDSESSIYCSVACARADAFSSLCYKPSASVPLAPALDQPSSSSADWNASHYRRLARADIRREERREERRRRRAEGSLSSSTSSRGTMQSSSLLTSSLVPELVGGHGPGLGHSRNASSASSVTSASSWTTLSRNTSNASTASSRRANVCIDTAIVEDDEQEYLAESPYYPHAGPRRTRTAIAGTHSHAHSPALALAAAAVPECKRAKAAAPAVNVRDMLDELISLENDFVIDEPSATDDPAAGPEPFAPAASAPLYPTASSSLLLTPHRARPPRTPSPVAEKRPTVPAAPVQAHRTSFSRPQSLVGLHQSSLSESHTALYLATASPRPPSHRPRRSASPSLNPRTSLTFTPHAGPALPLLRNRFDSPAALSLTTPRRARTPNARHPPMHAWRFPTPTEGATPTARPALAVISHAERPIAHADEPTSLAALVAAEQAAEAARPGGHDQHGVAHLLWPPPPNLAPSLFPCSPAGTPGHPSPEADALADAGVSSPPPQPQQHMKPPHSGLRLGVLLGSGDDGDNMDLDDEDDEDEEEEDDDDGEGGGGEHRDGGRARQAYFPVFIDDGLGKPAWA